MDTFNIYNIYIMDSQNINTEKETLKDNQHRSNQEENKQKLQFQTQSYLYYLAGLQMSYKNMIKMQCSHIMMLFFFIDGLDLLGKVQLLETKLPSNIDVTSEKKFKDMLIQYICSLQVRTGAYSCSTLYSNFPQQSQFQQGHLVFTYSAVNCLKILGALDRVNSQKILQSVVRHQKQDGSFSSFQNSSECDLRFVYSALSICKLLNDFSKINLQKTKEYIDKCANFDGGFGLRPYCESHCGAIYCAIASYEHLGVTMSEKSKKKTLNFLVNRQATQINNKDIIGIQGRVGKLPDSCYSFWNGASIQMICGLNLLDPKVQNFLKMCYKPQQKSFSKYPSVSKGDPVHTFHSNTALMILRGQTSNISLSQLLRTNQNVLNKHKE